jgi:hypothetical protein
LFPLSPGVSSLFFVFLRVFRLSHRYSAYVCHYGHVSWFSLRRRSLVVYVNVTLTGSLRPELRLRHFQQMVFS